jgi:hypothetical protein
MGRTLPSQRVPTLTEVVELARGASDAESELGTRPQELDDDMRATPPKAPSITEEQLTQRVLADLQRQVDLVLDYRLREVLAPTLSRLAESLVRDVRKELASTLRDVVARAVSQELSRHSGR